MIVPLALAILLASHSGCVGTIVAIVVIKKKADARRARLAEAAPEPTPAPTEAPQAPQPTPPPPQISGASLKPPENAEAPKIVTATSELSTPTTTPITIIRRSRGHDF